MRLSRHARNEIRLYRIDPDAVETTMNDPAARNVDDRGNARLTGRTADGRPILVVVAGDDPDFVITVFLLS
jgi:cytolysin (calcineurin-like family phosphatase)